MLDLMGILAEMAGQDTRRVRHWLARGVRDFHGVHTGLGSEESGEKLRGIYIGG